MIKTFSDFYCILTIFDIIKFGLIFAGTPSML